MGVENNMRDDDPDKSEIGIEEGAKGKEDTVKRGMKGKK